MSVWNGLRALVFLRRAARALERIADSQAELAEIERERHDRETMKKRPRPTEFGSFDVKQSNDEWLKEQEARVFGQTPEDAT